MKDFIVIGSDHAGVKLKEKIKNFLIKKKKNLVDVGAYDTKAVDYPDIANKITDVVKKKKAKGILVCGSGTGMVIAANRKKGIRAVAAYDTYSAKMARYDNDSNVLCLRSRKTSSQKQLKIVNTWLNTKFSKIPRHKKRIKKLG